MKITLNLDETWANEETISTAVMDALHAAIRVEVQRIVKQMMKEHEAAIAGVAKARARQLIAETQKALNDLT